jgi:hypothetical protein
LPVPPGDQPSDGSIVAAAPDIGIDNPISGGLEPAIALRDSAATSGNMDFADIIYPTAVASEDVEYGPAGTGPSPEVAAALLALLSGPTCLGLEELAAALGQELGSSPAGGTCHDAALPESAADLQEETSDHTLPLPEAGADYEIQLIDGLE